MSHCAACLYVGGSSPLLSSAVIALLLESHAILISLVKEVSLPLLCSHLGGEIESCRDVISSGHLTAALSSLLELSCRACSQMFWYFFDFCNSFYIKIKVQAIHLCLHTAQIFVMLVPDPCRLLSNSLTCNQADFTEIFCTEISCP